jgi:hypothetical protein
MKIWIIGNNVCIGSRSISILKKERFNDIDSFDRSKYNLVMK